MNLNIVTTNSKWNLNIEPSFYLFFNTLIGTIAIILNTYAITHFKLSPIINILCTTTIIVLLIILLTTLLTSITITKLNNKQSNTYIGYTKEQAIKDYTAELLHAKAYKKAGIKNIKSHIAGEELANGRELIPIDEYIQFWETKIQKIKKDILSPEEANY